jgi:regulator of sigma E protease
VPAILDSLVNIALLLAILVSLVVVHEFGHFIVARRAGVKVHEFGIGFPPRARILHRGRDTLYTLNWLPIGGFVRLEGEDGESDDPRSFVRQSLRTRIVILLAGVAMNLLLAWLLMSAIPLIGDPTVNITVNELPAGANGSPSPAQRAGMVVGDTILAIDGRTWAWFDGPNAPVDYLRDNPGSRVVITVRHADGSTDDLTATLRDAAAVAAGEGALGIGARVYETGTDAQHGILEALEIGGRRTVQACSLILVAVRDLVADIAHPQVSGPIGIVDAVGTVRGEPPIFLIFLIALLSANLAVVNALPFPPMDGGRIAVALLKSASGGRLSVSAERATYFIGFMLLMAFLVYISLFDIARLGAATR